MRGFFVLVIIIDHLQRWPGIFDWITGQGRLWASAAEGFILISGIMIGLIRGRNNIDIPLGEVTKKVWWRASTLYVWAIITVLATLVAVAVWSGTIYPTPPGLDSFEDASGVGVVMQTITLRGTYGWSIFLGLYAVFLFASPIAIWLLRKNLWYVLLFLSALIWIFGFGKAQMFFSWQFLFFIGTIVGFYYKSLQRKWHDFTYKKAATSALFAFVALTLVASVFTLFAWPIVKQSWSPVTLQQFLIYRDIIDPYFFHKELPPAKLFIVLSWFAALFLLVNKYREQITGHFGWLLLRFGQNSLFVYILQGFIVVIVGALIPITSNIIINACVTAGTVLLIWWLTSLKFLHKIIPR